MHLLSTRNPLSSVEPRTVPSLEVLVCQIRNLLHRACKPIDVLPVEKEAPVTAAIQPYGHALNKERLKHRDSIQRYFGKGVCTNDKPPPPVFVKSVFQELCKQRSANKLPADAEWFARDVTYFTDENEIPFKNFIRKLWKSSTQ